MQIFGVRPNLWYTYDDDAVINLGHQKLIGIYALYDKSGLIYIGHSTNLIHRLTTHEKDFAYAKYKITLDIEAAQTSERKLIERLRPVQNKDYVSTLKGETKQINCTIDLNVYKAAKVKASMKDTPLSKVVNDALEKSLKKWIEFAKQAG
tara:strand:+ start:45 stop:494 length:450 start_codon:yes stop_codon:yes gene_type:complete